MSDIHSEILSLIQALLTGGMEASDFRLGINQFSETMVRNLFRDSLPRFASSLRDKFTDIFTKYFFNNRIIKLNDLWKFVEYRGFWTEILKLHNVAYSRNMNFNEIVKFFERNLFIRNAKIDFSYLEQKTIEMLNNDPLILYKTIANELRISEKKVSTIIKNLRSKGIYLGSVAHYSSLNFFEFFTFDINAVDSKNMIFADEYFLFPKLKLIHGVHTKSPHNDLFFQILEKKIICNPKIFCKRITIQDWRNHSSSSETMKYHSYDSKDLVDLPISANKEYFLHLMRHCENNYKKPAIQKIAEEHNISARTLFRIKFKLQEKGILQPSLVIESNNLFNLVIVSPQELVELYNKVPFMRSFRIRDSENNSLWLSFLSIFVADFKFLYLKIHENAEIYQIMNKKSINISRNYGEQITPFNHKVYTK